MILKKLPPNKTYDLIIDYPMDKPAIYKISTGKYGMGLVRLLGKIDQLYQKTYGREDESENGVYGHDIGDLSLSGIKVNHKTKKIRLEVDS